MTDRTKQAIVDALTIALIALLCFAVLATIEATRGDDVAALTGAEWSPDLAPRGAGAPGHACEMCPNCCDKCNVRDECCCRHPGEKCKCPAPRDPAFGGEG